MVTLKIDEGGNITSSSPKTVKVRILREVWLGAGVAALLGDIWELSRADAVDLLAVDSAERVTAPGEIEIRSAGLEVIAKGDEDPEPRLIFRIPESQRPPRAPVRVPLNGHLWTPTQLRS
jgi:hypothetical protein